MAQVAYHVSMGLPLWGMDVRQGTVLYMALEDTPWRLTDRMFRMFGVDTTDQLRTAICAPSLEEGLIDQLRSFLEEFPDTQLIILDTFQKVRGQDGGKYSYADDYRIISELKDFTDSANICLLAVHHTRKAQADDPFDRISGTNGLLGAADGAFVLEKARRIDDTAILYVSGRDQSDQTCYLRRNCDRLTWDLDEIVREPWKEPTDPLLDAAAQFMDEVGEFWSGPAAELAERLSEWLDEPVQPNALTRHLNVTSWRLKNEYLIVYSNKRTQQGSKITLKRVPGSEPHAVMADDGEDASSLPSLSSPSSL